MATQQVRVQSVGETGAQDRTAGWRERLTSRLPAHRWRTRFAPAPTGFLHMGHLVNAIHVWGIARAAGGLVVLRIEDHDGGRCRAEYEQALLDDLDWLGFEPDEAPTASYRAAPVGHPGRQSARSAVYANALAELEARDLVYPCRCTRKEIELAAPHAPGMEPRYPGTCAYRAVDPDSTPARRVRMTAGSESFDDLRLGPLTADPSRQCGDVLVRDRAGYWSYQFAASVDDTVTRIDVIIRGEDLLPSTARQIRLARLLGRSDPPLFLHHPLLVHADGRKLSKANRDTAIRDRRAAGASAAALLGEAAWIAGLTAQPGNLDARDVGRLFSAGRAAQASSTESIAAP